MILLCLTCACNFAKAAKQSVNVIAIEYPPFTSKHIPNQGIAFELLRKDKRTKHINWQAIFVPPARAHKLLNSDSWCASFYPTTQEKGYQQLQLGSEIIKVGLIRKAQNTAFKWNALTELDKPTIALLRTGENSTFAQQFKQANMDIAYVETIEQAMKMVLLGRVSYAMFDNISYNKLPVAQQKQLQFSTTSLIETYLKVLLNDKCNIALTP